MKDKISIDLKNDFSEIERLHQIADAFAEQNQFDQKVAFALNLVLEEIVTNIIKYGYQDQEQQNPIHIDLSVSNGELTIVVQDEGQAFDPTMQPEPNLDLPVEQRPIGGLGIHLVRNFMDSLEYKRDGNKNVLVLKKKLQ